MKTATEARQIPAKAIDPLKQRILDLRPLPMGWRKIYASHFPEYDTVKGFARMANLSAKSILW
jgi:hypothetical protein